MIGASFSFWIQTELSKSSSIGVLVIYNNLFFSNWQVTPLMSRPHVGFSIIFFKVLTDRLYSPRLVERKIHCHQKKNGPPHVENYVNNFQISLVKTLSIAL